MSSVISLVFKSNCVRMESHFTKLVSKKYMVKRFGLENARNVRTPMSVNKKLIRVEYGSVVDPDLYRNMIASLLYLTASRLDICFDIRVYARYQERPKKSHLTIVKHIICYISVLHIMRFGIF